MYFWHYLWLFFDQLAYKYILSYKVNLYTNKLYLKSFPQMLNKQILCFSTTHLFLVRYLAEK